jgi:hypothetical protein
MTWFLIVGGITLVVFGSLHTREKVVEPPRPRFSPEYLAYIKSDAWKRRRRLCLLFTFGRDALCPWLQATQADHLHYRSMGRELPLFDIVPLNARTHESVTIARMMFGRGPVNLLLRAAYLLWFTPYIAIVTVALIMALPQLYPALGFKTREILMSAMSALNRGVQAL